MLVNIPEERLSRCTKDRDNFFNIEGKNSVKIIFKKET